MMTPREEIREIANRHIVAAVSETVIPGLRFYCTDSSKPVSAQLIYEPMVCIILQGEKRVLLGSEIIRYTPKHYLLSSAHLPVTGTVLNARPDQPYLAVSLTLDAAMLSDLVLSMSAPAIQQPTRALGVGVLSASLLDAFLRLTRLLEEPSLTSRLAPLVTREIAIRLLESPDGSMLRQMFSQHGHAAGVARATRCIREGFAERYSAAAAARAAGMSLPSFNRHFRITTGMSPLQYQKQIRLQEARRMLFAEKADAASVGYRVGYASPSQFSREYARTFGLPPQEDVAWLRSRADVSGHFFFKHGAA